MTKILLIDDDAGIREVVRFALDREGFTLIEAEDGARGLRAVETETPDLVLLDIMMPELDGNEVCQRIRRDSNLPIIFLTSRDEEIDRVLGLELGGDDYVSKPFSPRELVARVRAVLRRSAQQQDTTPQSAEIRHGALRLDLAGYQCFWNDTAIALTATEFAILRTLAGHPGRVFGRDTLMTGAYGHGHYVSDRTVDSHVRRIRGKFGKLGASPIETVHSLGFKLSDCR